jgi:hypothetical protein
MYNKDYYYEKYINIRFSLLTLLWLSLAKRKKILLGEALKLYRGFSKHRKEAYTFCLDKKKSDTLVILGSGKSILDISKDEFERMKSVNTFAMNFWCYHDFVPDFFCFEGFKGKQKSYEIWKEHLLSNNKNYENTIFLGNAVGIFNTIGNLCDAYLDFPKSVKNSLILYTTRGVFVSSRNNFLNYHNEKFKKLKSPAGPYQAFRASLSIALQFAYLMKYKRIILYGIDLNNSGYFWKNWEIKSHLKTNAGKSEEEMHNTALNNKWRGIQDYIYHINDKIFKPEGIVVEVANKSSLLYPNIPFGKI